MRLSARPLFSSARIVLAKQGSWALGGDGVDLGPMFRQRPGIGGAEMLGPDAIEGWGPEGGGPGLEERVFHVGFPKCQQVWAWRPVPGQRLVSRTYCNLSKP